MTSVTLHGHHARTGVDIDWEEIIPFGPVPARPSVRDSAPVRDAQHLAEVAKTMRDLDMTRPEAERFLEIEEMYTSIGLPRGERK